MTTQTKHTYHAELKHAIETDGAIDGNVLAGCLAEWETSSNIHNQLVEALKDIEANLTGEDHLAERVADSLRRTRAALALAEKGME